MNSPLLTLLALSPLVLLHAEPQNADILLFQNGDTLHGIFKEITPDGQIVWLRDGWENPANFAKGDLNQITLNKGHSHQPLTTQSSIYLNNGDIIAGDILTLSSSEARIQTTFAGVLTLPRKFITRIQPTLFGGELIYRGPTDTSGWEVALERTVQASPENKNPAKVQPEEFDLNAEDAPPPPPLAYDLEKLAKTREAEALTPSWLYQNGMWYATGTRPLVSPARLPDKVKIRFKIEWIGHLYTSILLHGERPEKSALTSAYSPKAEELKNDANLDKKNSAELKKATQAELLVAERQQVRERMFQEQGLIRNNANFLPHGNGLTKQDYSASQYPHSFKNAYILQLTQGYVSLQRSSLDQNNQPANGMVTSERVKLPITQQGLTEFEIRCDRESKLIALFVNGRFLTQWIDSEEKFTQGNCLAFCKNRPNSKVRISELLITSWDGNMDSANSMEHPERDVLITNNGTDRYSGAITSIQDNSVQLKGTYGELSIPLAKLFDIRLARNGIAPPLQHDKDNDAPLNPAHALVTFAPYGRLTLELKHSENGELLATHPLLGELSIKPASISSLLLGHAGGHYLRWDF